jgi:ElaB/YqjD/DUF883 family membrane-anchored ribosome-binding protein
MTSYSTSAPVGTSDWILGAIKRNPEGLLLLAAGCALMMRRQSATPRRAQSNQGEGSTIGAGSRGAIGENAGRDRSAREFVSEVADTVSETASSYASNAADYADTAVRAVSEQSRRVARQAQSGLERTTQYVLQDQPLAIAVMGLVAGAAVAAVFPSTEVERRALGPTGERLRDAAGKVTDRLKDAGTQAGEQLMSAADERGLTKEGLKEVARDVGGAFNAAITGENTSQASKNKGFRQASSDSPKSGQATQSATPQSPAAMKRDQR